MSCLVNAKPSVQITTYVINRWKDLCNGESSLSRRAFFVPHSLQGSRMFIVTLARPF